MLERSIKDSVYSRYITRFPKRMQKIRTIFTSLVLFVTSFSLVFPVFASLEWVDEYDYSDYIDKINISSWDDSFHFSKDFWSERTTFILRFEWYSPESADDIEVIWQLDGKTFHRHLDWDNESWFWDTTFPFVTTPRKHIEFSVQFSGKNRPKGTSLITSNQSSVGKKLTIHPSTEEASADDGVKIVKRSEWWADESLRYVPTWKIETKKQEWEERWRLPKIIEETPEEQAKRIEWDKQYNELIALEDDANTVVRLSRYEGKNKLLFPTRTAKKISRIFIHHTAEWLEQDADDASLIRAIYLYHAKTKGWGDIGYNFIIGQRGVIYEWRAWGDYVEWAHVYANNLWTVGISVIGNYQSLHLNRDQRAWLVEAITYVAKKYGINASEQAPGIMACKWEGSCIWKGVTTYRLSWHRDAGNTSCPGDNIYDELPSIRNEVVWKVWKLQPVYNTDPLSKDPLDPEDEIQYMPSSGASGQSQISSYITQSSNLPTPTKSTLSKAIKIQLSYPSDTLTFRSATDKKAVVRMNAKILPFGKNMEWTVFLTWANEIIFQLGNKQYSGKTLTVSSDVVRIPSWNRVPAWDSSRRYNDNLFRGKLYISNQGGKLLVVNELPIEDYLKWLGEVSDSDHSEKIKTILVAARTYAYYYTKPENRKYNTKLYDGSDNPDEFQKYLGYGYEMRSPNVSELVEKTKGLVITYGEKLIKSWYFSSSDGNTRSFKEYCEANAPGKVCEDIPYLQSVSDPAWVWKTRSGHWVGISWIGATYAANMGKNFKQIIGYYLKGTLIRNVNALKN